MVARASGLTDLLGSDSLICLKMHMKGVQGGNNLVFEAMGLKIEVTSILCY